MKYSRLKIATEEIEYNVMDVMDLVVSLKSRMTNKSAYRDFYGALSEAKDMGTQISNLAEYYINMNNQSF